MVVAYWFIKLDGTAVSLLRRFSRSSSSSSSSEACPLQALRYCERIDNPGLRLAMVFTFVRSRHCPEEGATFNLCRPLLLHLTVLTYSSVATGA